MDRSECVWRGISRDCEPPAASPTTAIDKPSASSLSPEFWAWQARMDAGARRMHADEAFRKAIAARLS